MIFEISTSFLKKCQKPDLSDIACGIAKYGHFINVDKDGNKIIRQSVNEHASTNQKECFRAHTDIFDIPDNLFAYLRVCRIDSSFSSETVLYLVTEPARLVIENANNEWPVYKYFIDLYNSDSEFGTYFKILKKAKDKGNIIGYHAGGSGELLKCADDSPYQFNSLNLRHYKTCVLFDRDTSDDTSYDGNKNALFRRLARKDYLSINDGDIYTLSHNPLTWHMWYKRAIENYFSDEQYNNAGFDTSALSSFTQQQRDYALIGGNKSNHTLVRGYDKASLQNLLPGLSRTKVERHLKKFSVNGVEMSEMQLFMLKLVRIL